MKIDFRNGSTIKTIDSKKQPVRSLGRTVTVYPITLDWLRKHHCPNCMDWHGDNHNYGRKSCETCIERIEWSQICFGKN